jgi:glycosyltransferase involved in cell wall biosynthesis
VRARLAVNGRFLSQATTGTQRYALELVMRLVERHPGRVVLHVPHGTEVPAPIAAAAEVRESRARGQLFEQVALPWATRRDLLLSLGGPAPVAARRQVATIHDVSVFRHPQTYSRAFRTWYRAMYRVLSRRAVRVLTVSQFSADELGSVLHVTPSRVSVVPNGADHVDRVVATQPDLTAYPGLASGAPWVLCVGTFARHKNLGPALDALEAAGIDSVVVGARGSAAVFAEAGTGRWTRAHFAGRLSDEELAWLYGHATALVFPSLYEGFGIPVVEAQRLGCPVVTLDTAPMREVGGDAVVLCDPAHPEQVVDAVRRLLEEPGLRAETIEAGRRNAERFSWDASADRLEDALAQSGWSW